ncbi:hypothetical protein EV421DRAFT_2041947 [Armillaria borealis]|uniref:Protein kinase domain-containing protein n=1 Tax=Armillaria borealis TaxID=47425 RepID=A0AA39MDH2_9AGAR|nr:hypothetical protein EV421DRAFT_2041947 [Armillaria borealis]
MKANDDISDEGMKAIRLLEADQDLQLKQVSPERVEGALFLDGGGLRAATEHLTSLDKQVVDDIPSTLGVSSRTRKHKSDSSDESSSKISCRTYDSQAFVSARRALDPINEDEFASISDDEQKRMFSAMLIGYHRLTPLQRGILDHIIEDPYIKRFEKTNRKNPEKILKGLKLTLQKADETNIVHRQGGLIGRNTCVVTGTSSEWPGMQLVVKISWPSIYRDSEKKLVDAAKAKADEIAGKGKRHWVLDHLPEILHSQDFRFNDKDSPQSRLMKLLIKDEYVNGPKMFLYEECLLRITVSERLFPLDTLTDVKEIGQVFLDILQCHRWLFDHPKILHRDISMSNVMYRRRSGQVCGVLNDFDLSSFYSLLESSSLHRTGTAPYMARDLLEPADVGHLYRHDLEALFYVLMMLCCRFEIVLSDKKPVMQELNVEQGQQKPFADWFNRSVTWNMLSDMKAGFLASDTTIPTSTSFTAFLPWLQDIRYAFGNGFQARANSKYPKRKVPAKFIPQGERDLMNHPSVNVPAPFDNETLGGYIFYSHFLAIMSEIGGHSLVIKNVQE